MGYRATTTFAKGVTVEQVDEILVDELRSEQNAPVPTTPEPPSIWSIVWKIVRDPQFRQLVQKLYPVLVRTYDRVKSLIRGSSD